MSTTTMSISAQINAFVDTTRIFDVVQKRDRTKLSNTATVAYLKDICNAVISLTSVPDCLADSVGFMKMAHKKFLEDSPRGEKEPLQAMLLPVAVAAADAVADNSATSSVLALYSASVSLQEDDVCMSDEGSGGNKRPRANASRSASAVPDAVPDAAPAAAPAASAAAATPAASAAPGGSFSTCSLSSSLASGRVGRGSVLKNELPVGSKHGELTIVGYSPPWDAVPSPFTATRAVEDRCY